VRTLVDLPEEDVDWLDRKAAEEGKSRAAVVREAVALYRAETGQDGLERYFGLWKQHGFEQDGLSYQQALRAEWDRDWDADEA
jgi:hypothetical protein